MFLLIFRHILQAGYPIYPMYPEGLFLYEDAMGVLTNSPGYDWHCTNLLNYMHIRDEDYGKRVINSHVLNPCFSGSGALGLPGDCSSPSRFVRLAFLKEFMQKGRNEEEGVAGLFHMMGHVSFPAGLVKVGQIGEITEIEEGLVPYDYTVYTAVMCAESLSFYWTTYENQQIRCVDMRTLLQDRRKREILYPTYPHPAATPPPSPLQGEGLRRAGVVAPHK